MIEMVHVLIVEDERYVAEATKAILEQCYPDSLPGFRCIISPTVRTAGYKLASGIFDVVLTDWDLPDGDGNDVMDLATCPVVVYSGGVHSHQRAMQRAHTIIQKPSNSAVLRRALYHAAQTGAAA